MSVPHGPPVQTASDSTLFQKKEPGVVCEAPSSSSNAPNKPFGPRFAGSTVFPSPLFGAASDSDATKALPATSTIFPTPLPTLRTWQPSLALQNITFGQVSRSASPFRGGAGQPTKDAITQIQSEASLFPRAASVISSVPPKTGSGAAPVPIALSAALPTKTPGDESSKSSAVATQSALPRIDAIMPTSMDLLRGGTTVRIVVGTQAGEFSSNAPKHVWDIEPGLISRYSQTLRNACNRKQYATERICITLPEDDPYIFELFYMWMLDGTTTGRTTSLVARNQAINLDAQAWIIGDQMRSIGFKNYAMNRLYDQYATNFAPKAITPADVAYAFTHRAAHSKLRQFYLDLFPKQWKNLPCISKNVEEWDEIVHEHKDFRMRFYDAMSPVQYGKNTAMLKNTYMEVEDASSVGDGVVASADQVIPAKRKAEDVLVKKEVTADS